MCAVVPPTTALAKVGVGGCRVGFCQREQGMGVLSQANPPQCTQEPWGNGMFSGECCFMPDSGSWVFLPDQQSHCDVPLCAAQPRECIHSAEHLLLSESVLMNLEAAHPKLGSCLDGSLPSLFKGCFL